MISAFFSAELGERRAQRLGLGLGERRRLSQHDQRRRRCLGRQRVPQRQRAHLLGQVVRVAAHHRAEGAAAAAELRHAAPSRDGRRRCPSACTSSCRCGAISARSERLVRAGPALGELPAHHAGDDVGARLEAENRVVELDRAGGGAVERRHVDLHRRQSPFGSAAGAGRRFGVNAELAGHRRVLRQRLLHRVAHRRSSRRRDRAPRPRPGSGRARHRSGRRADSASSRARRPCGRPSSCS